MSNLLNQRLTFERSGYFFIGLFLIAILGFWPSYFAKFFNGTADFNAYFHFHALTATLWIAMLIAQPILIRQKKWALHRSLGKVSYLLIPLIFVAVILLAHSRIVEEDPHLARGLWVTFKDLLILGTFYIIAIRYRKDRQIHARAMVVAGMVLIEPAIVRLYGNTIFAGSSGGYPATIITVYLIFLVLIIAEWKQKRARWVFPLAWAMYLFVHGVLIFRIDIAPWQAFATWFASLPLA